MSKRSSTTNNLVPAILVEHATVAYGETVVVEDVSVSIPQGTVAALIGPNGSGKTTLMRAMLGLVPLKSGSVQILGHHLHEIRQHVGYVPQRFEFDRSFPVTVQEFLQFAMRARCTDEHVEETLKEVGLMPVVAKKRLGTLSGGQLQRVLIASAIIHRPSVLFLDEPSTGIDIVGEAAIYDVIAHLNQDHATTIVMVSHDVAMVSNLVDQVICVNRTLLCSGTPRAVLTDRKLSEVFGGHTSLYHHEHDHHRKPR